MADEAIVSDGDHITNETVGLDFSSVANNDTLGYFSKWSNETIISYLTFVSINRFNDTTPSAYVNVTQYTGVNPDRNVIRFQTITSRCVSADSYNASIIRVVCLDSIATGKSQSPAQKYFTTSSYTFA